MVIWYPNYASYRRQTMQFIDSILAGIGRVAPRHHPRFIGLFTIPWALEKHASVTRIHVIIWYYISRYRFSHRLMWYLSGNHIRPSSPLWFVRSPVSCAEVQNWAKRKAGGLFKLVLPSGAVGSWGFPNQQRLRCAKIWRYSVQIWRATSGASIRVRRNTVIAKISS